jgi:hypothetical protein
LLVGVCVAGIAGMIVTSITDHPGGALTFGLLTAVAAFGMILVTAVTNGGSVVTDEERAEIIEEHVDALVAGGADERLVRSLVREVRRLR